MHRSFASKLFKFDSFWCIEICRRLIILLRTIITCFCFRSQSQCRKKNENKNSQNRTPNQWSMDTSPIKYCRNRDTNWNDITCQFIINRNKKFCQFKSELRRQNTAYKRTHVPYTFCLTFAWTQKNWPIRSLRIQIANGQLRYMLLIGIYKNEKKCCYLWKQLSLINQWVWSEFSLERKLHRFNYWIRHKSISM